MHRSLSAVRRSQGERTDATRTALIDAARTLFQARGFAATGTPEIVAAAQVTRGALYHHFADKTALFHAVAQRVAQEVADDVASGSEPHERPIDALMEGASAYFASMAASGRARLLLLEAPAVLAPEQVMALNERAGFLALKEGLAQALGAASAQAPIHELAVLLSAAFDRAALAIARGEPVARYHEAFRCLLTGLVQN